MTDSYPRWPSIQFAIAAVASAIIGTVTFWESMVAYGKLEELYIQDSPTP